MKIVKMLGVVIVLAVLGLIVPQENSYAQGGIVVPNEFADMSGDLLIPSALTCSDNPNGIRAQSLYPAEDFVKGSIFGFASRLTPFGSGFSTVTIPNVTIKLSTTTRTNATLSPNFADNVGPDETIVHQGPLTIDAVPDCNSDPCPFPPLGILQTPFDYDPANGNLLFEIVVPPCVGGIPNFVDLDGTSDLVSVVNQDFDAPDGNVLNFGLITKFGMSTMRPIPTVSEWGLIAMAGLLGIVGFITIRRRYSTA